MLPALAATLAIVALDHTPLRSAPRAQATELTTLSQGEVLEVRDERAGYLKVYSYHRERGGYVRSERVRTLGLSESDAPGLLAVLRFLRDSAGSEALGISYGAGYLKAAPGGTVTGEPLDAIGRMAERLADAASASGRQRAQAAAHLEVAGQFGIHVRSFEREGRLQYCYDGELFREVLAIPVATVEERARAVLALTRPDCVDPTLGIMLRALQDAERSVLLDSIEERSVSAMLRSRLHARRAAVWAALAYEHARRGEPAMTAAQRAIAELLAVHPQELGDEHRAEYLDAVLRVGAIRWAAVTSVAGAGPLVLTTSTGAPGETCVMLSELRRPSVALVRRCTYGIVWSASAQTVARGRAFVLAVQPLESWRELWIFRETGEGWTVDVLPPGAGDAAEGYVEFAGFAAGSSRVLIAREVREHGRFARRFEELRLEDLLPVKQASSPELLADFGRWQDVGWRRDTLSLH
ncbi:MAG TPA: SH3 domain-containing protein [Steroidobacteraceae bacterium]|nr:SH3 domain-containing protein [Steroidobacteraceae bacterium]